MQAGAGTGTGRGGDELILKEKILVSACLLGEQVRYDGIVKSCNSRLLESWQNQECVIAICPEVAGGLPVPRPPAEIFFDDHDTDKVRMLKVITRTGHDVTENFSRGAKKALEVARSEGIKTAILKDGSPSCGSSYIYDGTFSGKRRAGKGITASLLESNGIAVFNEKMIQEAVEWLSN